LWLIWRARNDFIFSTKVSILKEYFENIKRTSWKEVFGGKVKGRYI
jgi:hypothetical protein